MVTKICEYCGEEFSVINCRANTAKYCSRKCLDASKKAESNVICSVCGKAFHMKPFQINRYARNLGIFCSRECLNRAKEEAYCGEGNHQYGLKGTLNSSFKGNEVITHNHNIDDILVYYPSHPYCNKNGRVKKHRLLVEENYTMFDFKYFEIINDMVVLKRSSCVHHIDGNHDNNSIDNLIPCTKAEHKQYHKATITERDNKGRIIKAVTAVYKQGELLETPEVDNQQPS